MMAWFEMPARGGVDGVAPLVHAGGDLLHGGPRHAILFPNVSHLQGGRGRAGWRYHGQPEIVDGQTLDAVAT